MSKLLRWAGYGLAGLVGIVLLAGAGVWAISARTLEQEFAARPEKIVMAGANVANGQHLLLTRGCVECHGEGLRGSKFFDDPEIATLSAPNLTLLAAKASDEQLARAIRQGIGHDGHPLFVMPSTTYSAFTDQEVADLIAAIRATPRGGKEMPGVSLGPIGRFGVATGKFETQPAMMAAYLAKPAADVGPAHTAGRHIAMTICADCHGSDLTGKEAEPGLQAPDLAMVGAYSRAQFAALMKTGLPPGGRELKMMSNTSRKSFSHFTDAEVTALFNYLQARARGSEQVAGKAVGGA